jgi:hypothetical protein
MLLPFDEYGYLPVGIHVSTIDQLVGRFGAGSPEREVEAAELLRFVEWARHAGVRRLLVNGSFVTAVAAPNDVDLVILPGTDYPRNQAALGAEELLWPFLRVFVAADDADLQTWATSDFGTDRESRPKGVVEVIL